MVFTQGPQKCVRDQVSTGAHQAGSYVEARISCYTSGEDDHVLEPPTGTLHQTSNASLTEPYQRLDRDRFTAYLRL